MKFDPYRLLGLPRDATPEEVKAAQRRAAKRTHPDVGGNADAFAQVQRAATLLLDDKRRAKFDATGDADEASPNNEAGQALELVCALAQQAVDNEQVDIDAVDLVRGIHAALEAQTAELLKNIADAERRRNRMLRAAKRFRKRSGGENRIARMLERNAAMLQASTDDARRRLGVVALAKQIASDYDYGIDAPQWAVPARFALGGSVTGLV